MELSEEEKKIIDIINGSYDDNTQYVEASAKDWNCIVHLIRKQQKEIEELKEEQSKRSWVHIKENGEVEPLFYISKDKIRAKLKEYQEKAEDVKQKYKGVYAYKDDYLEALAKIEGYQELLEENDE